ncbi:MAG TPA: hypothetical protein VNJ01_04985 [Bacteriovoracaceae bacterium]|nr:hypothetical protein [Bacteriovoracaceae bacterium]
MRLFSIFFILILSVSCGKDSGSGSSSKDESRQGQETDGTCPFEGRRVPCESVTNTDGLGVDLLDVMVEVPISVAGNTITFLEDKNQSVVGRRGNTCKVAVRNGEKYTFTLSGNSLNITTDAGSYQMERFTEGSDLDGTWGWQSYLASGERQIRQLSILHGTRAIVKTNCEM